MPRAKFRVKGLLRVRRQGAAYCILDCDFCHPRAAHDCIQPNWRSTRGTARPCPTRGTSLSRPRSLFPLYLNAGSLTLTSWILETGCGGFLRGGTNIGLRYNPGTLPKHVEPVSGKVLHNFRLPSRPANLDAVYM